MSLIHFNDHNNFFFFSLSFLFVCYQQEVMEFNIIVLIISTIIIVVLIISCCRLKKKIKKNYFIFFFCFIWIENKGEENGSGSLGKICQDCGFLGICWDHWWNFWCFGTVGWVLDAEEGDIVGLKWQRHKTFGVRGVFGSNSFLVKFKRHFGVQLISCS